MKIQEVNDYIARQESILRILKTAVSDYDYNDDILDMPFSSFCRVLRIFNAQKKSLIIEDYFNKRLSLHRISPSLNAGDASDKPVNNSGMLPTNAITTEYKFSTTNESKCLNLRQIRNWQDIDYYIIGYLDGDNPEESILLRLTKQEMQAEVDRLGSPTHGTKQSNANNVNIEYSITLKTSSDEMKEWIKRYSYDKLDDIRRSQEA